MVQERVMIETVEKDPNHHSTNGICEDGPNENSIISTHKYSSKSVAGRDELSSDTTQHLQCPLSYSGTMQGQSPIANICSGCHQAITDKYLLKAVDQLWHEDCLKCSCCDCRLGEVGSTLFIKSNLLLCKRDYLRLFGVPGKCSACLQAIPAFEMVMRAKDHVYHLDCFACQQCGIRFCVGDRFYLVENNIFCQNHFPEGYEAEGSNSDHKHLKPTGSADRGYDSRSAAAMEERYNVNMSGCDTSAMAIASEAF